jgi:hypothetical protein
MTRFLCPQLGVSSVRPHTRWLHSPPEVHACGPRPSPQVSLSPIWHAPLVRPGLFLRDPSRRGTWGPISPDSASPSPGSRLRRAGPH